MRCSVCVCLIKKKREKRGEFKVNDDTVFTLIGNGPSVTLYDPTAFTLTRAPKFRIYVCYKSK